MCQGLTRVTITAKAVTTVLGPLYYWGLIFGANMGLAGAGWAFALVKATNAALLLGYLAYQAIRAETSQNTGSGASSSVKQEWSFTGSSSSGGRSGGSVESASQTEMPPWVVSPGRDGADMGSSSSSFLEGGQRMHTEVSKWRACPLQTVLHIC